MNEVVLVTGAARGIGRACALRLAQDGMNIAVNYNQNREKADELVDEIKELGQDAIAIQGDVSKKEDVTKIFREVQDYFGKLDILINNAGIVEDAFLMMLSDTSLERCLDTNIKGNFYCSKQAALKMFRKKQGRIINMSSISSFYSIPGQSVYSASKGAINSLTKSLAKELAPMGINVNGVAPGFIDTDMVKNLPEDKKAEYRKLIPLKDFGSVEDVAELVSFLCSDKSKYITGQVFVVDGGLSL